MKENDTVRIQNHKGSGWRIKARVERLVAPNSYLVQTEAGSFLRRNQKDLLKTSEPVIKEMKPKKSLALQISQRPSVNIQDTEGKTEVPTAVHVRADSNPSGDKQAYVTQSVRVVKKPKRFNE